MSFAGRKVHHDLLPDPEPVLFKGGEVGDLVLQFSPGVANPVLESVLQWLQLGRAGTGQELHGEVLLLARF